MIQAVAIGDDEGAVFEEDADPGDALAACRGLAAIALRDAADDG